MGYKLLTTLFWILWKPFGVLPFKISLACLRKFLGFFPVAYMNFICTCYYACDLKWSYEYSFFLFDTIVAIFLKKIYRNFTVNIITPAMPEYGFMEMMIQLSAFGYWVVTNDICFYEYMAPITFFLCLVSLALPLIYMSDSSQKKFDAKLDLCNH